MPNKVDPDKARKQWLIAQTVIEAGPGAVILYADESRVQLLPLIRAIVACQVGDSKQILLGPSLHAVPARLLLLGRQPRQEQVPQCYSGSNVNDLLRIPTLAVPHFV
jgi:hypothetical protein